MDYELLVKKSTQIGQNSDNHAHVQLLNNMSEVGYYIMPNLTFTCAGNITGFLLGVDVRMNYTWNPRVFLI